MNQKSMSKKRKREESINSQSEDPPDLPEQQELPIRSTEPTTPIAALDPSTSPQAPPSIGTGLPLTKANLRRLEKSTATSNMGGSGSGRKKARTESMSHPEHTDGSSHAAVATTQDVRNTLAEYNYLIDDERAQKDHGTVMKGAMKIIDGKRGSAMGDDEQKELVITIRDAARTNEDTFIDTLWWDFIKQTRMVPKFEMRREDMEDDDWMSWGWKKDFLAHNRNKLFRTGCLPILRTDSEVVRQLLESLPKLAVPKPDLIYGIRAQAFTAEEHQINLKYNMFTDLSQARYHPFFVIEFKTHNGSIEDAMNQASRTGAAIVNGLRGLDDQTPHKAIKRGVDTRTWCFSMTLDTSTARLFVNWAFLKNDGTPIYHMHSLASYRFDHGGDLAEMKRHIDNVMDWGLGDRLDMIRGILGDIHDHIEAHPREKSGSGSKK